MTSTSVLIDRHDDPYAWLMEQAQAVKQRRGIDYAGLAEFIEEAAGEMMSRVTSQMTNLMAHVMKVIYTHNPNARGHWRSEIVEFQNQIADAYRPSMRQRIDLEKLWRRARKLVMASFYDHGEPVPHLPSECPFTLDMLTNEDISHELLVGLVSSQLPAMDEPSGSNE